MKCHKCQAENINEAVKCGICGARLRHPKQRQISTDDVNVDVFTHRVKDKKLTPLEQERETKSVVFSEMLLDEKKSVKQKIQVFFETWQKRANDSNSCKQNTKKKSKMIWILLAIFMFGPVILAGVLKVVLPTLSFVVGDVSNEDVATDEEDIARTEIVSNEYQIRYYDLQGYQERLSQYYQAKHRLATSLKDIEKFEKIQFSDFIFDEIELTDQGFLVGKFVDEPISKIYMIPQIKNNQIYDWKCYRVNIDDDLLNECEEVQSISNIR